MKFHPGLVILVNKEVVAAVSSENLNIISVRICGDVISPEVAVLDVTGGYYGDPEETRHLIWVNDRELLELDEVEIQLQGVTANSHAGKTIDEIYSKEDGSADDSPSDLEGIAAFLRAQPRVRNGFDLHVRVSDADLQVFRMKDISHSFFVSIMWDWRSNESARLSVSSSTIQNIAEQAPGEDYLRRRFAEGQSVYVRVGSH